MTDVMLDFETLGNGKNACVIQYGACFFDRRTGEIGNCIETNINWKSAVQSGGELDADTIKWWMSQSDEARQAIMQKSDISIQEAFYNLNQFLEPAKAIWSHATFDFVILMETLKRLDIKPTFSFRTARDLRTLVDLANLNYKGYQREGVHHNALDDCKFQVRYCVDALNKIGGKRDSK